MVIKDFLGGRNLFVCALKLDIIDVKIWLLIGFLFHVLLKLHRMMILLSTAPRYLDAATDTLFRLGIRIVQMNILQ